MANLCILPESDFITTCGCVRAHMSVSMCVKSSERKECNEEERRCLYVFVCLCSVSRKNVTFSSSASRAVTYVQQQAA